MTLLRPNFRPESWAQNAGNGISGVQISKNFIKKKRVIKDIQTRAAGECLLFLLYTQNRTRSSY
jgi:hypothetical protein